MSDAWQVFQIDEIIGSLGDDPVQYKEFLRVPSLSCGVYRLELAALVR